MLGQAVESPASHTAEFVIGTGEVEPGADVPATGWVDERDGVCGAGQPPQDTACLLPVRVEVAAVPPRRPLALRRQRVDAVASLGGDLIRTGRVACAGRAANRGRPLAGEDPPPPRRGAAAWTLLAQ